MWAYMKHSAELTERSRGMKKEVFCKIYGPCFGQFYGYVEVDGIEDKDRWLGNCPADIREDIKTEYPNAHITAILNGGNKVEWN